MGNGASSPRSQRLRTVAALAVLGLFAWGIAAVISAGTTGARADARERFRDLEAVFLVPHDGNWFYVKVGFFMHDDGQGGFEAAADAAREEMRSRFPGAIEVDEHGVSAQYVTSGFKWMSGTASWAYNSQGEPASVAGAAASAMQSAATTWGQQGVPFSFTGGGPTTAGTGACGGGTDGSNTVGWGPQSGSVLAVTCSWYSTTGSPYRPAVEFDMEFDPDWNWTTGSPTQVDLQSVALHEFGHALGLNHSSDGSAVMFASYPSGAQKRQPTADDIQGLNAIYGAGEATPTPSPSPSPTSTPTATSTPTPGSSPTPTVPGGATATPTPFPPTATPFPPTSTPFPPTATPGGPQPTPTRTPSPGGGAPAATPTPGFTATATPTRSPSPAPATPTPTGTPPSLPILPGANLLAWPGNDVPPAQALGALASTIKIVYGYDAATGAWVRYAPGLPAYLNNMALLKKGQAYWFIAKGAALVPFEE